MAIIIIETLFLRPHPNKQLENEQRTSPKIPQPGQHVQGLPQQLQMPPSHSRRAPSGPGGSERSTMSPDGDKIGFGAASNCAAVAAAEAVFFRSSAIPGVDRRLSG